MGNKTHSKAGIYLHVPFCKQACHYCDFHFSTSMKQKEAVLAAMHEELELRAAQGFLPKGQIDSIYFGGGTPSLLEPSEIYGFLDHISRLFDCSETREITLEANPDDLSLAKIRGLKAAGINRLSVGVQSFYDEDLIWMNRAHRAEEALTTLKAIQEAGISNITADLIYGFPLLDDQKWASNVGTMIDLGIPHISAYSMTVEPRTALGAFVSKGKEPAMDEEQSARQFEYLMDTLKTAGYDHYEISNWAMPGHQAVHNANYWKGNAYLGIGPSAHSFSGRERSWNIRNNSLYVKSLESGQIPYESETLTERDRLNEYIMTALRTSRGFDLAWVESEFGEIFSLNELRHTLKGLEGKGWILRTEEGEQRFALSSTGKLLADRIASDLFMD